MRSTSSHERNGIEGDSYRELRFLEEVGQTPEVSQRHLAHRVGVALGVTNLLVRNLTKKGYIQVSQVGWKRWAYVVTPAGISRRAQLTFAYIDQFLGHYRRVRRLIGQDLDALTMSPESRIAVYGTNELAELVYLAARNMGVTNIDFCDSDGPAVFLGSPVKSLDSIATGDYVKVLVAFSEGLEARCQDLRDAGVERSRIVTLLQRSDRVASLAAQGGP